MRQQLDDGLQELSLSLDEEQHSKLLLYLQLLEKWNKVYNLTAIESQEKMVSLHLLDSLSIVPFLEGKRFIDVGSGAGLPGIPLAIALPDKHLTLLDSNSKRTRFLLQTAAELKLENVSVIHARAEQYQVNYPFDGILSRAYSTLRQMVEGTRHLCNRSGHFFAMKGQYPQKELSDLPKGFNVGRVHQLSIPGVDADRHLLVLGFDRQT